MVIYYKEHALPLFFLPNFPGPTFIPWFIPWRTVLHKDLVFIKWQLMSALASLERSHFLIYILCHWRPTKRHNISYTYHMYHIFFIFYNFQLIFEQKNTDIFFLHGIWKWICLIVCDESEKNSQCVLLAGCFCFKEILWGTSQ